jgi:hypothetical protein
MSSEAANPVVEVVNGDKQDIRLFHPWRTSGVARQSQRENGEDKRSGELLCHTRSLT